VWWTVAPWIESAASAWRVKLGHREEDMKAQSGMDIITLAECLRLLGSRRVGRLGFLVGDQPFVLPVNYAVEANIVLFRTGLGTKLEAVADAKVAFEVDQIDERAATGWSVVVQGTAQEITSDVDVFAEALRAAAAPTWVPNSADHYMRIVPRIISGRRLPGTAPTLATPR
jgi:nitroimidazol reductase NimA-like FMN-containing flavoprotein (pyridoxamine 5'-phosphate oxidase superfamily)